MWIICYSLCYSLLKEWVGEVQLLERAESCPFFWSQIDMPESQQPWETAMNHSQGRRERIHKAGSWSSSKETQIFL